MKQRKILILAVVMALVTAYVFSMYLQKLSSQYEVAQSKTTIVVAKSDIQENQKLTMADVELKEVSSETILSKTVTTISDAVDKYATTEICVGEPIMSYRLITEGEETGDMSKKVKSGYRAVSIEASFVDSVSNLIKPNDYVDIVFTYMPKSSDADIAITTQVLDNVKVLAVGKSMSVAPKQSNQGQSNSESTSLTAPSSQPQTSNNDAYTSVTLELSPEDAIKIINLNAKGSLKFVLRSKVEG